MTIPSVCTYDIVGAPRRPGVNDVGGAAFVDDQANPPDPTTMLSSLAENQGEMLTVAAHSVIPVCRLSVTYNGSAYVLAFLECASTLPTPSTFTLTRNSAGNVSITWPANTFPTPTGQPTASFVLAALLYNATIGAQNITNGVQVFMTGGTSGNAAAAGTDQSFTVEIH